MHVRAVDAHRCFSSSSSCVVDAHANVTHSSVESLIVSTRMLLYRCEPIASIFPSSSSSFSSLGYFPAIIIPSNFAYSRRNDASSTPYLKDEYSALVESPLFLVKWTSFFKEKGKKILPPLMASVERFNYDGILYRLNRLPREFFFLSLSLFLFQLKRELRTSSLIKI